LPKISEVLAEQIVMPTLVNADHFEVEGKIEELVTRDQGQGENSSGEGTSDEGQVENVEGA
jgi:hypothetical protein